MSCGLLCGVPHRCSNDGVSRCHGPVCVYKGVRVPASEVRLVGKRGVMVGRVGRGGLCCVVFCVAIERCGVWFHSGNINFVVKGPIRLADGDFKVCLHMVGVDSCECFLVCDY